MSWKEFDSIILPQNTSLGTLSIDNVYAFYDFPQIISCKNENENEIYVGVCLKFSYGQYKWLYSLVSNDTYEKLNNKQIYLRNIFTDSDSLYVVGVGIVDRVDSFNKKNLTDEMLPEPNIYVEIEDG